MDDLGRGYEASLDRTARRRQGSFFTPPAVAGALVRAVLDGWPPAGRADRPIRVCDPSCGGGVFLLAVGREIEKRFGLARSTIVADCLWGIDLDPDAAATCAEALLGWVAEQDPSAEVEANIAVADALTANLAVWASPPDVLDLVIGNPPFQNQLATGTARDLLTRARVQADLGPVASGYADTASLFVVASLALVRPGGRVALILPDSFLAARDATLVRAHVEDEATLAGLWMDGENLFEAAVRVCALVLDRRSSDGERNDDGAPATTPAEPTVRLLQRWTGPSVKEVDPRRLRDGEPRAETWSPLVADLRRLPDVELDPARTLGSIVSATAGFRDQFYGLVPFVEEAPAAELAGANPDIRRLGPVSSDDGGRFGITARLVTSGLIDPVACTWGRRSTRFGGMAWQRPTVDLVRLRVEAPKLAAWAEPLLVPKVVLATQTRVLEVAVDRTGEWWPSVPVIAIRGPAEDLSLVAAVLSAPPVSVWAMASFGGTALSSDAVKLAARQVLEIPLPVDDDAWAEGAQALELAEGCAAELDQEGWSGHLDRMGVVMCAAYRVGPEVFDWWRSRRPPPR